MIINRGLLKEEQFIDALNEKKVSELSNNLRHMLTQIYGLLDENEVIKSALVEDYQKPDFYVEYKGEKKYISLKTGRASTVGQQLLKNFVLYLRGIGVSIESQKTILLYHYGDGTLDGSGGNRLGYNQLMPLLEDRIKQLNKELNANKELVLSFISKHVFEGTVEGNIPADYIYHGNLEYGVICSKKQILKHVERSSYAYMDHPHIGPLLFRPHARYSNKEVKSEFRKSKVDIYWPRLSDDLLYISERYNG